MRIALGILLAFLVLGVIGIFVLAKTPQLEVQSPPAAIGDETPVTVRITSPHGFQRITLETEQDGKTASAVVAQHKPHRLGLFKNEAPADFTFNAGRKQDPSLHDGKARLTVTAQANDLVGRSASRTFEVMVTSSPTGSSIKSIMIACNW